MLKLKMFLLGAMAVGIVAAPQAYAELAENATFYGKMHVSADYSDDGKDSSFYSSSNSSRLGFKGSEELNNSLDFVWQVESTANLDDSGSTFATRNSYAGLNFKDTGILLAGRHDTPFKLVGRKADLFGDRIGDSRNIIGTFGAGWNLRASNLFAFKSAEKSGFHTLLAYIAEEGEDNGDALSGYFMYDEGPLLFALAAERHGKGLNEEGSEAEIGFRATGTYNVDALKVGLLFEVVQDAGGVEDADSNAWGVGLSYKIDAVTLKGQYYGNDGLDGVDESGADMIAVGADYSLAKNTTAYFAFATTMNEDAASFIVTGGGHGDKVPAAEAGEDALSASVGLIHKF